ncbi:hypothetical protein ACJRO7_006158 [Eucalyptus globulus]|uniref:Retrotransposon gag domain-containing protein n=1 Tax=Eucalyptus globulus TaxID=34317 RepID=A0ABD3IHW4_EUCGL
MPARVGARGGRGKASAMASVSGKAPLLVGVRVVAPDDPRFDRIMRVLEALGNRMDQQALNQAAVVEAAAQATLVATVAAVVVAPAAIPVGGPPEVVVTERPIHKLVEQFLKLHPPRFTRIGDLEAAALLVQNLEKAFALLRCNEIEKVILATYRLERVANTLWRTTQGALFSEGVVSEWNAFLAAFNDKYFSETTREVNMVKFQRLRQGSLIVDQYEAKFTELSQYAPKLIKNPINRVRRFRDGFRPDLRSILILLDLRTYNDLYGRAHKIEKDHNERAAISESRFNSH